MPERPVAPTLEEPQDEEEVVAWQQLAAEAAAWPEDHEGLQAFRENHVNRLLDEKGVGRLVLDKETKAGARFLHKYGDIEKREINDMVEYLRDNGASVPQKAAERATAYLDLLANPEYVNDGMFTGNQTSMERQVEAHVIKEKDIPESYFALQRRIAWEQGYGDMEITSDVRRRLTEVVQADQRAGLKKWADYLTGDDGGYPDWFKQYAFGNIVRMGKFDQEKDAFQKRDATTVAPYPELSRGALSQVYTWVKEAYVDDKKLTGIFAENQQREATFQNALKQGNFAQLYVQAIHKSQEGLITDEERERTRGSWKQYQQNSDASRLHGDLQGFGLDWCTATGYETAMTQLQGGDFYVYYTRDEAGKDAVPRVAIRMQNGEVAEVRGINTKQELEPAMADIAAKKLQDLPGGDMYIRRAEDMKRLTGLDNRMAANANAPLSKDDIKFLYELDHQIDGFGYQRDPRIDEIRAKRADRDHAELKTLAVERLRDSFETSAAGYRAVAGQLEQAPHVSDEELHELFAGKLAEWQERGVLDYVAERIITHGELHTPVITPNVLASYEQISTIAKQFGKDQPYETYIDDELYSKYKPEELSGEPAGSRIETRRFGFARMQQPIEPVRFSLLPSTPTEELGYAPVEEQRTKLAELRERLSNLNVHVPSVLDAVTFWQTLRARGDKLVGSGTFDKTYIRHFDLAPVSVGGWSSVPYSYVRGGGEPYLVRSRAGIGYDARVAVG